MSISVNSVSPSFSAKIHDNKFFREVVDYAFETGQEHSLATALYSISKIKSPSITVVHGRTPKGISYSSLALTTEPGMCSNNCRPNQNPVAASLEGLIDIAKGPWESKKFSSLFGNAENTVTKEEIINHFTTFI